VLRRFSVNYAIFSVFVDAVCVAAAAAASSALRPLLSAFSLFAPMPGPITLPPALFLVFPISWVAVLASLSLYDGKRYIRAVDEFSALTLASLLAGISLAGVLYLSFREVSRAQYLLFVTLGYGLLLAWRIVARMGFRLKRQRTSELARRVLIVGCGPLGRMVESRLQGDAARDLSLLGFVDDRVAEGYPGTLLGATSDLAELVASRQVTDIVIALPPHFYERIRDAVATVSDLPVKVWIALGFYDLALYRTVTEDFAGLPLLDLRASALDDYERFVKRAFDLVFGAAALIVLFPLLLISALAVWIGDHGPVFFLQDRVGENGRVFRMLKLRTMIPDAPPTPQQSTVDVAPGANVHKRRDDPRVTAAGRFLRRFSLDEIPQLVNVLRGEMSLVGPRPELPPLVQQYEPWQRQRLAVPPGMTGWWQVTGRSDKIMHLNTEDDMYYVRNYSIWLDVQILVRTIWVVLLGRGAF